MRPSSLPSISSLLGKGGEGPGGERKSLLLILLALLAWGVAFSLWVDVRDLRVRRDLQRNRFIQLTSILGEYVTLRDASDRKGEGDVPFGEEGEDLLTAVSNVVASLGLRSNMQSLSSVSGRGGRNAVSVTLEGLSSESLAKFLQETERRGVFSFSAEIRAVRAVAQAAGSSERTLTAILLLGER